MKESTVETPRLRLERRLFAMGVPVMSAPIREAIDALDEQVPANALAQIKRMQDFLVERGLYGAYADTLISETAHGR